MSNIKKMEATIPVAPLKIAALDSCKELGEKVNDYIVEFRQHTPAESLNSPLFFNHYLDNYLIALSQRPALLCPCGSQRAGESMLPVLRETVVSCFSSSEIDKSGIYIFYYIFYFSNIYVSQKAAAPLRFQAPGTASAV